MSCALLSGGDEVRRDPDSASANQEVQELAVPVDPKGYLVLGQGVADGIGQRVQTGMGLAIVLHDDVPTPEPESFRLRIGDDLLDEHARDGRLEMEKFDRGLLTDFGIG